MLFSSTAVLWMALAGKASHRAQRRDGFAVSVVQNPTISLADDVVEPGASWPPRMVLWIPVGHSYGGAVITEAGNDPKVVGLAHIRGLRARPGRVGVQLDQGPASRSAGPTHPAAYGRLSPLDKGKFGRFLRRLMSNLEPGCLHGGRPAPLGWEALGGTTAEPAWRSKPSWYLVATDDRMIPPAAQRFMSKRAGATVVEVAGSHAIYVSQPAAVANLIATAAKEDRAMAHSG